MEIGNAAEAMHACPVCHVDQPVGIDRRSKVVLSKLYPLKVSIVVNAATLLDTDLNVC